MRREAEFFGDAELPLLYMARRLRDAKHLEAILTEQGIDYAVETGPYTGGFLFARELTGAFFYVLEAQLDAARELLLKNEIKPYG